MVIFARGFLKQLSHHDYTIPPWNGGIVALSSEKLPPNHRRMDFYGVSDQQITDVFSSYEFVPQRIV